MAFTSLPLAHSMDDLHAAAGEQSRHFAVRKGRGQGRQQVDERGFAGLHGAQAGGRAVRIVALQQHLRDAGGGAEVAVDLERRVGVEQVRE